MKKAIRTAIGAFKTHATPSQIAFGCVLGIFFGLTPIGAHTVILCFAAIAFRGSIRATVLAAVTLRILYYPIGFLSHAAGFIVLEQFGFLKGFWIWLFGLPVVGFLGLERYMLTGSLVVSAIAAVPVFLLARWIAGRYRALEETKAPDSQEQREAPAADLHHPDPGADSETGPPAEVSEPIEEPAAPDEVSKPAEQTSPTVAAGWFERILPVFLAVFGRKESETALRRKRTFASGILNILRYTIRPGGALVTAVVFLAALIVLFGYTNELAKPFAEKALTDLLKNEVTIGEFDLDLSTGKGRIAEIEVADRHAPGTYWLYLKTIDFHIDTGDILRGNFTSEGIDIDVLKLWLVRDESGAINALPEDAAVEGRADPDWGKFFKDIGESATAYDWTEVLKLYSSIHAGKSVEPAAAPPLSFNRRSKCSFVKHATSIQLDYLRIAELEIQFVDRTRPGVSVPSLTDASFAIENLSLEKEGLKNGETVSVRLKGLFNRSGSLPIWSRVDIKNDGGEFRLRGKLAVREFSAGGFSPLFSYQIPIEVDNGFLTSSAAFALDGSDIAGSIDVSVSKLAVSAHPDSAARLGISQATLSAALKGVNAYAKKNRVEREFTIYGTTSEPEVDFRWNFLEVGKVGIELLGDKLLEKPLENIIGVIGVDAKDKLGIIRIDKHLIKGVGTILDVLNPLKLFNTEKEERFDPELEEDEFFDFDKNPVKAAGPK